jgi:hypothetical protein
VTLSTAGTGVTITATQTSGSDTLSAGTSATFTVQANIATKPTVQASNINFPTIGQNSMTVSWTNGNGAARIVIASDQPITFTPVDGTSYPVGTTITPQHTFVFFNGTGNSFDTSTLAGVQLPGNTTIFYRVFEYNGSGGTEGYLTSTATNNPKSAATLVATYTWNNAGTDYGVNTNWTPNRSVGNGDILLFNSGGTSTVQNIPSETIGQLKVSNSTVVNLSTSSTVAGSGQISRSGNTVTGVGTHFTTELRVGDVIFGSSGILFSDVIEIDSDTSLITTQSSSPVTVQQSWSHNQTLTLSGEPGTDLTVGSGSQLNINGSNPNNLRIALQSGVTGDISGSMTVSGTGNVAHRLTALDAGAITFESGAVFTSGANFIGSAYGNTALNAGSVIFKSGSTYDFQNGSSSPFGAAFPNAALVFQTGSLYKHESSAVTPSFNGRKYANVEINSAGYNATNDVSFTAPLEIDNLTVTAATLFGLNFGGGFAHAIHGNVVVNGGSTVNIGSGTVAGDTLSIQGNIAVNSGALNFNPTTAGTVTLNGSSPQTISGAGTLTFNSNQGVTVDDPGMTLSRNVTLSGPLALTNGLVSTGANTLQVGSAGSVTRTNGYVVGNLQKNYSVPGLKTFEVGTANGYSPVDVNVTTASPGGAPFTVSAVQGTRTGLDPTKALARYWTLAGPTLTADLTFHYLDPTDIPGTATESNFVIAKANGSSWSKPGGTVNTVANTATITGVSSFSDWTLAEPSAIPPPPPSVTSVSPTSGPTGGGTVVTITGSAFTGVTQVSFGGTPAASFSFNSDTQITATSPARASGAVHVSVTTPSGNSALVPADQFTYNPPQIVVNGGPFAFGSVTIGNTSAAQSYTVSGQNLQSDITVTAPPQFQVSTSPNSGFGGSLSLTQSGGNVTTQTIYVRFVPTLAGGVSPTVNNTSTNAPTQSVTVTGTGVTASCAAQPSGMVAWYRGENNALDIRGGNNGTLQGAATFAGGKVGQAFSFPGNVSSYVSVPSSPSLNLTQFTVDAWIFPTTVGTAQYIVDRGNGSTDNYDLALTPGNNVEVDFTTAANGHHSVDSVNPVQLNTWSHITGTYDGTTEKVYVNGVLDNSAVFGDTPTGGQPIFLGKRPNNTFPFTGQLDEVEIFNHALTTPEISAIYNASTAGKCTLTGANGPIGWWPGDGDARDITVNADNGTLQGGASFALGKVGQSFNFDGSTGFVSTANPPTTATDNWTMEAWINPGNLSQLGMVMSNGFDDGTSGNGYAFGIANGCNGNSSSCVPGNRLQGLFSGVAFFDGGFTFPSANQWYHVAMVRDSGTVKFYVNGVQTTGTSTAIPNTPTEFRIGSQHGIRFFNGRVDEPSIYNRVLTGNEIQSIFDAGIAGKYKSVTTPPGSSVSSNAGGDATATFGTVTNAGITQQVPLNGSLYPALPGGQSPIGFYYDVSTSASYTGVTVCFHLPMVPLLSIFTTLRIDHFNGTTWDDVTNTTIGPGGIDFPSRTLCTDPEKLSSLSPFAIGTTLAPTAARVTVSGRVLAPGGAGLRNASVVMTDPQGATRRVITNAFGYYTFDDVMSGSTYIMGAESRHYRYASRVVLVSDALAGLDFTPIE